MNSTQTPGRQDAQEILGGLHACVHCGFCLPACPTYEATADEADSPRGRIVLMRALAHGELPADDPGLTYHLDRCLGCRACESVCPSGVVYGPALEAARERIAETRPLPAVMRVALWALARPERQRLLWSLSRAVRASGVPRALAAQAGPDAPRLASLLAMLAATAPAHVRDHGGRQPASRAAHLPPASRPPAPTSNLEPVALLTGCVMDGLFSHVHEATRVVLEANGCGVAPVPGQVCCGALAAHAGDAGAARALARENISAFDAAAPGALVVVDSAGCGAMLKSYGHLLEHDPLAAAAAAFSARVRDVSEVLAERGPRPGRPLPLRVAYDAPCHLLHAQRVADAPLTVLRAVPGLELVPLEGGERCCGSAGLYALVEPQLAGQVLAPKLAAIRAAAPDVVATGNPGCLMQIGAGALLAGLEVEVRHPVELLAWSYTR